MTKRMLIDATHPEETRVVVLSGNKLDEFDFETSTKKQLKGNIYLAKVTRVEPSLQAAFVDFGGNRHGFLAFSEIHPDYYQIPVADRMALLKEQEAELAAAAELDDDDDDGDGAEAGGEGAADTAAEASPESEAPAEADGGGEGAEAVAETAADVPPPHPLEVVGGEDEEEIQAAQRRRVRPKRQRYKIQEVIKRRQILLVQVVKEERGNKGAALTTYLSLAGRYCVLMPNTGKGGGISRKITSVSDRKRLKKLISDMDIPRGMAVILRTAAVERSKAELRRDFEFLMRSWEQVRELTLNSIAPTLVYEEANLIKRSIRDLYTRDIEEVLVDGDEGYKTAKEFMRMLMPSHAKKIKPYKDPEIPLFHRYQVEGQLDAMHSPRVQLKSGGYIVINPTEALVSIDVNSGRATRERNIEETAYKTNVEAAEEIARQLKLRDLAGLIVIDFIDMAENRNQHNVERRLKEAMRADRARIQIGRISAFGLLELSRQRLRPSLIEASTLTCPHCEGTGLVRSTESAALHVLRAIEEEGIRHRTGELHVTVAVAVALYILNQKRDMLRSIEERYGFHVTVLGDDRLIPPDYEFERGPERPAAEARPEAVAAADTEARGAEEEAEGEAPNGGRRRRRRRGQRGEKRDGAEAPAAAEAAEPDEAEEAEPEEHERAGEETEGAAEEKPKRRRRGRRGGRRRKAAKETAEAAEGAGPESAAAEPDDGAESDADEDQEVPAKAAKPRRRRRKAEKQAEEADGEAVKGEAENATEASGESVPAEPEQAAPVPAEAEAEPAPQQGNGANGGADEPQPAQPAAAEEPASVEPEVATAGDRPRRRGWWNRLTE